MTNLKSTHLINATDDRVRRKAYSSCDAPSYRHLPFMWLGPAQSSQFSVFKRRPSKELHGISQDETLGPINSEYTSSCNLALVLYHRNNFDRYSLTGREVPFVLGRRAYAVKSVSIKRMPSIRSIITPNGRN